MQLGAFKIPETRLEYLVSTVLKKIYEAVKTEPIQSKDLSKLLGYKYGTEPTLFKRINSLLAYGLMEGRGIYNITKLGQDILFPESHDHEAKLKNEAIMNVELWKKLYETNKKDLPKEGLWVQLKNITEVDPATARKYERRINDWYTEDISLISKDFLETKDVLQTSAKGLTSTEALSSQMAQQLVQPNLGVPEDYEKFELGKSIVTIPKTNIKKEWDKVKRMIDIYLEDYQESQSSDSP